MDPNVVSEVLDKGGIFALAVLIIWRIEGKLDKLVAKLAELKDAVRELPRDG